MLLPSTALAFWLLVEASALSGLRDFNDGVNPAGFMPGKDRQYILTGTSFEMDGCIHQVKVLAEPHGGVLAVDVWRSDDQSGFTLASSVEVTPSVLTRSVFILDASPAVEFKAGDLIGFHLVGSTVDFQVGWTSAPSTSLVMSSIFTRGGDPPVTVFPTSWTVLPTTWPVLFLSTSSAGLCTTAPTSADVPATSSNVPEVSSTMALPPSLDLPSEIVLVSSTTSTENTDTVSAPVDVSIGFPGDSPIGDSPIPSDNTIPPGAIAGILVTALVVILLVTFSIFFIIVCRLNTRKANVQSWKAQLTYNVHHHHLVMNSLSTSCSPLIQEAEPKCVDVVMQPNPAYSTTFASTDVSDITTPSVLPPPTPASCALSPPVVIQPNPAYSTALGSGSTATNLTAQSPSSSSPVVPNQLYRSHSQLTATCYTSPQANHHPQADEDDHMYCSVSTYPTDVNVHVYDYIDK